MLYEKHDHEDSRFPVFFHKDTVTSAIPVTLHWHRSPEFLYVTKGSIGITMNLNTYQASEGMLVAIPSNAMHTIFTEDEKAEYYCMIPDHTLCEFMSIPVSDLLFTPVTQDKTVDRIIQQFTAEFSEKKEFYKPRILSLIMEFLVHMSRNHLELPAPMLNKTLAIQLETIRCVLSYINEHYAEPLTIDELSALAGYSRYYFCHVFKEMTRQTPVDYINFVRCTSAKKMISTQGLSVGQAALKCGFSNLSYFTRTYKKQLGELPSKLTQK